MLVIVSYIHIDHVCFAQPGHRRTGLQEDHAFDLRSVRRPLQTPWSGWQRS